MHTSNSRVYSAEQGGSVRVPPRRQRGQLWTIPRDGCTGACSRLSPCCSHLYFAHFAFQVAKTLCSEVSFPRAAACLSKTLSSSRAPPQRVRMELAAVTCISIGHHVAFLRLPHRDANGYHRWAFYDSMSKIEKGHRVPLLFEVPGLARYFEEPDASLKARHLSIHQDGYNRDPFTQRLEKNAFMSFYVSQQHS